MDIRIDPKALQAELNLALGIVESKATIPILSNLLLRAEGDSVELAATDLEVTLRTRCSAEVIESGALTVPAKKFGQVVRLFQGIEKPLSLKNTPDRKLFLQPVGEKGEYHLQTLPEEDYPTLLEAKQGQSFTLDTASLRRSVSEVLVSVGTEDNRYSVRGAMMLLEPDSVTFVSTDSHRLSKSSFRCQTGVQDSIRILIPKKPLVEFLKLEGSGEVRFTLQDNHIFMEVDRRIVYSRLLDVTFPAFERVIPQDTNRMAVMPRVELSEKLQRIATIADAKTRAITMVFDPAGPVEIAARNAETGDDGREYLLCERYEGEEVQMCFNVDYIVDFLRVSGADLVSMRMKEAGTQILLEPVGCPEGTGHGYVVMPLRMD